MPIKDASQEGEMEILIPLSAEERARAGRPSEVFDGGNIRFTLRWRVARTRSLTEAEWVDHDLGLALDLLTEAESALPSGVNSARKLESAMN